MSVEVIPSLYSNPQPTNYPTCHSQEEELLDYEDEDPAEGGEKGDGVEKQK